MEKDLNREEQEKLRLENEIRKMKLELEQGAKFFEGDQTEPLPPEIENEFLNYIEQFEKMNADSPRITVYEKCGKPPFLRVDQLDEPEIESALAKILDVLHEHGIQLSTIHEVEPAELYRFITEELFEHEMYDMFMMKGMMTHFIYEEFYPDDIKDVNKCIEDFFPALLDLQDSTDRFKYYLENADTDNKWLTEFRSSYIEFNLHELYIRSIQVHDAEDLTAEATFEIHFDGYTAGRTEKHLYKGPAQASLAFSPGGWEIQKLILPQAV